MANTTERLDAVESALANIQQATNKILDAGSDLGVGTLDEKLDQILDKIEDLRSTIEEFADQMEDTVYRMNRDRDGYNYDD